MDKAISYLERRGLEKEVEAQMIDNGHDLPTHIKQGYTVFNWSRPDQHAVMQRNHMIRCRSCGKAGVVQLDGSIRGDALKKRCHDK